MERKLISLLSIVQCIRLTSLLLAQALLRLILPEVLPKTRRQMGISSRSSPVLYLTLHRPMPPPSLLPMAVSSCKADLPTTLLGHLRAMPTLEQLLLRLNIQRLATSRIRLCLPTTKQTTEPMHGTLFPALTWLLLKSGLPLPT